MDNHTQRQRKKRRRAVWQTDTHTERHTTDRQDKKEAQRRKYRQTHIYTKKKEKIRDNAKTKLKVNNPNALNWMFTLKIEWPTKKNSWQNLNIFGVSIYSNT